jgi:ribosomal-protein-alanine N-acetyltransferase
MFLEVDATNAAAIALYEAIGFAKSGRREGYYRVPGAPPGDALILKAVLPLRPAAK